MDILRQQFIFRHLKKNYFKNFLENFPSTMNSGQN